MNSIESLSKFAILSHVRFQVVMLATVLLAFGCKKDQPMSVIPPPGNAQVPAPESDSKIPGAAEGKPQAKLPVIKLWIGTNELAAEVAHTQAQIMSGMMWRTNMGEMEGMLFAMPRPHRAQFWMRNTLLPLSCAYIDPEGTILELHDMKPRDETPIPASSDQVQYVLEVNQGWFQRHNVTPGMLISTERGSLRQTFFPR